MSPRQRSSRDDRRGALFGEYGWSVINFQCAIFADFENLRMTIGRKDNSHRTNERSKKSHRAELDRGNALETIVARLPARNGTGRQPRFYREPI
jgi:hypothetical protein